MSYSDIKQLAEELLDIALKYDELRKFILTYPGYEVWVNDGFGNKTDSKDAKMQAIYKKHLVDRTIEIKLYDALRNIFENTKNGEILLEALEVVKYQLREQENNTAPFELDCPTLLEKMKVNIKSNAEIYNRSIESYPNGFSKHFEYANQSLLSNHGYSIL